MNGIKSQQLRILQSEFLRFADRHPDFRLILAWGSLSEFPTIVNDGKLTASAVFGLDAKDLMSDQPTVAMDYYAIEGQLPIHALIFGDCGALVEFDNLVMSAGSCLPGPGDAATGERWFNALKSASHEQNEFGLHLMWWGRYLVFNAHPAAVCAMLIEHLLHGDNGDWSEPMTKDDAAKLLKTTSRNLRRWIDTPEKSPYRIDEINRRYVRIWLEP